MFEKLKKLLVGDNPMHKSYNNESDVENVLTVIPFPDGRTYSGEVEGIVPHGYGRMSFPNGNVYEGEFRQGQPNGMMIIKMANGDVYEGEMKNGLKSGKGKYTWVSGQVYEGNWSDDKRNGYGVFTSSGASFTGIWVDSFLEGEGVEIGPDGYRFEGVFHKSRRVKGKITLPTGDVYEGEFQNNLPHGYGKETVVDGRVYEGYFERGLYNGYGKMIFPKGIVWIEKEDESGSIYHEEIEGHWLDGHLVD